MTGTVKWKFSKSPLRRFWTDPLPAAEKEEPSFVWLGEGEDRYWLTGRVGKGTKEKSE